MDPNAALENMRRAVANYRAGEDADMSAAELVDYARDMAELFAGLDEWVTGGGFLPAAWQR